MPKRMSATVREAIMTEDRSKLDLKRSVWNDTGFVNVIKVDAATSSRLASKCLVMVAEAQRSAGSMLCLGSSTPQRMLQ